MTIIVKIKDENVYRYEVRRKKVKLLVKKNTSNNIFLKSEAVCVYSQYSSNRIGRTEKEQSDWVSL